MKNCSNLVQRLRDTVPDVPREFSNVIINGVRNATTMVSSAIRNYGSVYGQNQMLEYSTDGKINDVTSSFVGREAISDSVLANLENDLVTLKSDYDAAWSTLPPVTQTRQAIITEELSASFSVGSGATAPESDCYIELGYGSGHVQFSFWKRNPREHVGTLRMSWSGNTATLTGTVPNGGSVTMVSLLPRLPGCIEISPRDKTQFQSFFMGYGNGNSSSSASLIIVYIGGRLTFFVVANDRVYTFVGGANSGLLEAINLSPTDVADKPNDAFIQMPAAIVNASLDSDLANDLTFSLPDGPSEIIVTQEVSKEVSYQISYNALPYEGDKIQNLIDALP